MFNINKPKETKLTPEESIAQKNNEIQNKIDELRRNGATQEEIDKFAQEITQEKNPTTQANEGTKPVISRKLQAILDYQKKLVKKGKTWDEVSIATSEFEKKWDEREGTISVDSSAIPSEKTGGDTVIVEPQKPTIYDENRVRIAERMTDLLIKTGIGPTFEKMKKGFKFDKGESEFNPTEVPESAEEFLEIVKAGKLKTKQLHALLEKMSLDEAEKAFKLAVAENVNRENNALTTSGLIFIFKKDLVKEVMPAIEAERNKPLSAETFIDRIKQPSLSKKEIRRLYHKLSEEESLKAQQLATVNYTAILVKELDEFIVNENPTKDEIEVKRNEIREKTASYVPEFMEPVKAQKEGLNIKQSMFNIGEQMKNLPFIKNLFSGKSKDATAEETHESEEEINIPENGTEMKKSLKEIQEDKIKLEAAASLEKFFKTQEEGVQTLEKADPKLKREIFAGLKKRMSNIKWDKVDWKQIVFVTVGGAATIYVAAPAVAATVFGGTVAGGLAGTGFATFGSIGAASNFLGLPIVWANPAVATGFTSLGTLVSGGGAAIIGGTTAYLNRKLFKKPKTKVEKVETVELTGKYLPQLKEDIFDYISSKLTDEELELLNFDLIEAEIERQIIESAKDLDANENKRFDELTKEIGDKIVIELNEIAKKTKNGEIASPLIYQNIPDERQAETPEQIQAREKAEKEAKRLEYLKNESQKYLNLFEKNHAANPKYPFEIIVFHNFGHNLHEIINDFKNSNLEGDSLVDLIQKELPNFEFIGKINTLEQREVWYNDDGTPSEGLNMLSTAILKVLNECAGTTPPSNEKTPEQEVEVEKNIETLETFKAGIIKKINEKLNGKTVDFNDPEVQSYIDANYRYLESYKCQNKVDSDFSSNDTGIPINQLQAIIANSYGLPISNKPGGQYYTGPDAFRTLVAYDVIEQFGKESTITPPEDLTTHEVGPIFGADEAIPDIEQFQQAKIELDQAINKYPSIKQKIDTLVLSYNILDDELKEINDDIEITHQDVSKKFEQARTLIGNVIKLNGNKIALVDLQESYKTHSFTNDNEFLLFAAKVLQGKEYLPRFQTGNYFDAIEQKIQYKYKLKSEQKDEKPKPVKKLRNVEKPKTKREKEIELATALRSIIRKEAKINQQREDINSDNSKDSLAAFNVIANNFREYTPIIDKLLETEELKNWVLEDLDNWREEDKIKLGSVLIGVIKEIIKPTPQEVYQKKLKEVSAEITNGVKSRLTRKGWNELEINNPKNEKIGEKYIAVFDTYKYMYKKIEKDFEGKEKEGKSIGGLLTTELKKDWPSFELKNLEDTWSDDSAKMRLGETLLNIINKIQNPDAKQVALPAVPFNIDDENTGAPTLTPQTTKKVNLKLDSRFGKEEDIDYNDDIEPQIDPLLAIDYNGEDTGAKVFEDGLVAKKTQNQSAFTTPEGMFDDVEEIPMDFNSIKETEE